MNDCRGELLHRVRTGIASAQEQAAFEAHLGSCESCRMTLDLMSDLDGAGEPEPGDWERVAQMASAGVIAFGRGVPVHTRIARRPWQLAVAALVLTGAAAAGVATTHFAVDSARGTSLAPQAAPPRATRTPSETPSPEPKTSKPSDVSEKEAPAPVERATQLPGTPTVATAAETYRAANDARRAGRTATAIEGYRKLQQLFPGSPEAHASRVSLGGLLLRAGSSGAALAQFDAYLASSGGQLTAEALFGRAQSLRALGRTAEEAQNLDRLVKSYPNSAYATHAERRLAELR